MAPIVEQSRTTEEQKKEDRGFEHIAAPALSETFEMFAFPELCRNIADLHVANPLVFIGISHSDGTNLPNAKTVLLHGLLGIAA